MTERKEIEMRDRYMTTCHACGDPNVFITGNQVSKDYLVGEIVQERTCQTCGQKQYVRLIYKLQDVKPIRKKDLPKG